MKHKALFGVACALLLGGLGVSSILAKHRPDHPDRGRGPEKVKLCHAEEVVVVPEGEVLRDDRIGTIVGRPTRVTFASIIEVAEPAKDAHLAHGDHEPIVDKPVGAACNHIEPIAPE